MSSLGPPAAPLNNAEFGGFSFFLNYRQKLPSFSQMKNPTMLYRAGGKHEIHGGLFDYIIVDEDEVPEALKHGWFLSTVGALAGAAVKESLTAEVVAEPALVEQPKRGRPRRSTEVESITDDL